MTYRGPVRRPPRRIPRILVAGLLLVTAAIAPVLGLRLLPSSASTAASPGNVFHSERDGAPSRGGAAPPVEGLRDAQGGAQSPVAERPIDPVRGTHGGGSGEADGAVAAGTTVFDDGSSAVANLAPGLLTALRRAATDAARDGVGFQVNSGWRSPEYQERLFREAVSEYGSEKEAARWVARPATSAHVSGDAVDIGQADAAAWLSRHGARYGLCQIYRNEPWHFELRADAPARGCPRMYADPTHDPRMQP